MKLNEIISAYYNCSFPAKLNRAAIEYYRDNSQSTRCYFFLEEMVRNNNYTLHRDDIQFMSEASKEVFPELFEAFCSPHTRILRKIIVNPRTSSS